MIDAVVSFLWADSAANEVLLESDGTQPSSFVAGFRPMRFVDGWGIVTPTSDADFAGMCRASASTAGTIRGSRRSAERIQHRELMAEIMDLVLRQRGRTSRWPRRRSASKPSGCRSP